MTTQFHYTFFLLIFFSLNIQAQTSTDSIYINKEFFNLDEALLKPDMVFKLNLSNQKIQIPDSIWVKFTNLKYLSLKNDHLTELPKGIGNLKNLEILDLSGNDFKLIPQSFTNLTNLEELFLNDEKYFNLDKNISVLSKFQNLKSLHIENDNLSKLPKNFYFLEQVEKLYLNNNNFKEIPKEVKKLKKLKFLDLHDNKQKLPVYDIQNQPFGIKIRF